MAVNNETYAARIQRKLMKKQYLVDVATGRKRADLVLKNATYVNVFSNELCHGDIAVAEGAAGAVADAGGLFTLLQSGDAAIALISLAHFPIYLHAAVGTLSFAFAAANAEAFIYFYDAVIFILAASTVGAGSRAGGLTAHLAHGGEEIHLKFGEPTMGANGADFQSVMTQGQLIFHFAGHLAAFAAYAAVAIYYKGKLHHAFTSFVLSSATGSHCLKLSGSSQTPSGAPSAL